MARTAISGTRAVSGKFEPPAPRKEAGFTLLELLVVLAVAGLLASIVLPRLIVPEVASARAEAARDLAAALVRARSAAVFRGREVALVIDLRERRYWIEGGSARPLPAGLDIVLDTTMDEAQTPQRGMIRFYPDGSATGGRIMLGKQGKETHIVRVNWLTGRVSIDG